MHKCLIRTRFIATVAVGCVSATLAHAEITASTKPVTKPAAVARAALPDWDGIWVVADSFMDKQDGTSPSAPGRFNPAFTRRRDTNLPAFQGVYLERAQTTLKAQAEGKPIGDNGALCLPQGMPSFWGGPYSFEIIEARKQINFYQEWNEQTRRVYLDGRKHPDDYDPTYNGHSIGHWEGNVLVVDTTGIRDDTRFNNGGHSDAMHIVERIKSIGPDLLEIEETVEDPKALSKPWVDTIHLRRKSGMEIMNYVCAENNRNPVGADGVTEAILGK